MALRPNNTQQPKLTEEEVIQVRKWFFENNWTYPEIEYETGFSYGTLRKAIHGRGKFYGSIEDGISPDLKKNRVPTKLLRKQWIYNQEAESEASAARYRREAEEAEAKEKARLEEIRREIFEKHGKKN